MRSVKGVIQVVGHYNVPSTPRDLDKLRKWYYEVRICLARTFGLFPTATQRSAVFLPKDHRLLLDLRGLKKHGRLYDAGTVYRGVGTHCQMTDFLYR